MSDAGAARRLSPLRGRARSGFSRRSHTVDITQSVLLDLHVRVEGGKVEFESEGALRAYLRKVVRHKLATLSKHAKAARRGGGEKTLSVSGAEEDGVEPGFPSGDLGASVVARVKETLEAVEEELTPEEARVLRGRLSGCTNAEIGAGMGKSADAVRMSWNRAREKLKQLRLDEEP